MFPNRQPIVELLENRRMLSADVSAAFTGRLPTALLPGETSNISVRLTNHGNSIARGSAQVELFASADTTLDAGDLLLGSKSFNVNLRPRASVNVRVGFPTPASLPDGDYYLLAEVQGSVSTIGSPAVAVSSAPVNIQTPFSDLSLQFSQLPTLPIEIDGASAGSRIATVSVIDSGNIPVRGKVNLSLYLSTDNVLDSSDPLLATANNRSISLKPGGHSPTGFRIAVPPGTVAGGYFLIATLTPAGTLVDSNAADNVAVSARRVAVVTQLPITPVKKHDDRDEDADVVDVTVVAPDCTPDTTGDTDSTDNSDDSTDNGTQNDSQPAQPVPDDSSNTSVPSDSSDTWDDGVASDGGDF